MYEFGVTRYFEDGWHVSAGYVYQPELGAGCLITLPWQRTWTGISSASAPAGMARRFDFDVTYQFGYGPAHTVTGSTPSSQPASNAGQSADGTYKFISHAVLVTVGMHF